MASFMMGQLIGGELSTNPVEVASENFQYAGFVQDNWKVPPNSRSISGLRYDVSLPRTEPTTDELVRSGVSSPLSVPGLGTLYAESCHSPSVRSDWLRTERLPATFRLRLAIGQQNRHARGYGSISTKPRRGQWLLSYGSQAQSHTAVPPIRRWPTPWLHLSNPFPMADPATGKLPRFVERRWLRPIGPLRTAAARPNSLRAKLELRVRARNNSKSVGQLQVHR